MHNVISKSNLTLFFRHLHMPSFYYLHCIHCKTTYCKYVWYLVITLSCNRRLFCSNFCADLSLFSYNNGMMISSCRELDNNRSALSAASAFAIATAGANEGTPTKEKFRRLSLAGTGNILCSDYTVLLIR